MSVLVPDHEVFSYLFSGLAFAANNQTYNDKYSYQIARYMEGKDSEKEGKRLVKSWLYMIEKSYNAKYNDTGTTVNMLTVKYVPFKAVQLLKYVQCVLYNIESEGVTTKHEQDDATLLELWKTDIMNAIIDQLPEYKEAKWSEI